MKTMLSGLVALLALAVGGLHLALNFVVFHGHIFSSPGGPARPRRPGGPAGPGIPGGLSLPQLFLANFIVYVVLAIVFVAVSRGNRLVRAGVDVLLILVTVATLVGWNRFRRPNPHGLGMSAVILEIALIVLEVIHALTLGRKAAAR
ncbi:MAG: hypothetical protein ACYDAG_04035 [Chloroflexota bacterium]